MAEKQELNSLNRFRKQSAKLVLEEHGHCEVPAGCGGVILRWRNPQLSRNVRVYCFAPDKAKLFMDGEELKSGLTDLAIGPHLLCAEIVDADLTRGLLAFVVSSADSSSQTKATHLREKPFTIVSSENEWKYTQEHLTGDDWLKPHYVMKRWPTMVPYPLPKVDWNKSGMYQLDHCTKAKATCLGVPVGQTSGTVRIRFVFVVPAAEEISG